MKFKEVLNQYNSQFNQIRIACKGNMQACNISSEEYTSSNYGSVVYSRGPLLFAYLNEQLGEELFKRCFTNFLLNVGHGSLGFTLALGSARLIVAYLNKQTAMISQQGRSFKP